MVGDGLSSVYTFFFFNDTATTEIYTLSLHDALPISFSRPLGSRLVPAHRSSCWQRRRRPPRRSRALRRRPHPHSDGQRNVDRKSTRLNSSHGYISYAVFCLKKKTHHRRHPPFPPRRL